MTKCFNLPRYSEFNYRGGTVYGNVVDEVCQETEGMKGGHYMSVIQLIEIDDEENTKFIRFGYYTKKDGKWIWGRFALADDISNMKGLLKKALKKPWFKELI